MPKASRDNVDADLSGIEKLSDLAAELTGETLTVSSPIPSPEMGFMDLEESRALHTLSDGFDSSFHSSMTGPVDQSTPKKSRRMRSDYRFECCIGMMATRDLLDTECEMEEMSAKEKETFLAPLIQENSSCHRQTVSYKGASLCIDCFMNLFSLPKEQWEKLRRRKKSAVPKRIRTSPKVEVAEAWMTNFLRWHGQHSPCSTKMIYVQGYNAKELHQLMICSLSKGIPKENLLHYTSFTVLLKKMKVSFGKDIPDLEDFKILVAPDWERARLEEVKKYISHYFPRMPQEKVDAWKEFSPGECQQPIIGPVGTRRQGMFSGTEGISAGMLAAVYTEDRASRPWVGEVKTADGDKVEIHWYVGTYHGSWKPMIGDTSVSSVPRESLLLWGFTFTDVRRQLRSNTREELRRLYRETDEKMAD
ncbi:unnamed protein product [Darwinula stevensoni]|uniref:Uncharacterized protein n=1 Tax=Darwinula stevensoni TaxID=69355 RepID=A0A7R9AC74_9CRUS|nr:unnamed protein product [Darwinula stevensoni]CAG0899577.1 unnamed protein product [Darwinula stevensoni]